MAQVLKVEVPPLVGCRICGQDWRLYSPYLNHVLHAHPESAQAGNIRQLRETLHPGAVG